MFSVNIKLCVRNRAMSRSLIRVGGALKPFQYDSGLPWVTTV